MNTSTINKAYVIQDNAKKQEYPAIQGSCYQPKTEDEAVNICLSEDSLDLLPEAIAAEFTASVGTFSNKQVPMFVAPESMRWVLLAQPRMFGYNKDDERYQKLEKGVKLYGSGVVTAARVILAAVHDGKLVMGKDGTVQLFTLNLTSKKTGLLGNTKDEDYGESQYGGEKTFASLNAGLEKHYQVKGWITRLVSVKLRVFVHLERSSVKKKDTSLGIRFGLVGGAVPLSEEDQKAVFDLVSTDKFKALVADPYKLNAQTPTTNATTTPASTDVAPDVDLDDIPF